MMNRKDIERKKVEDERKERFDIWLVFLGLIAFLVAVVIMCYVIAT